MNPHEYLEATLPPHLVSTPLLWNMENVYGILRELANI
jgi:hypothetical protein